MVLTFRPLTRWLRAEWNGEVRFLGRGHRTRVDPCEVVAADPHRGPLRLAPSVDSGHGFGAVGIETLRA
jgi:hypothetical protein